MEIRHVTMSAEIDKLSAAMVKAMPKCNGAVRNSNNPHFKNRYADLEAVLDAIREPLASEGLVLVQEPGPVVDGQATLLTTVTHSSGQFRSSYMSTPIAKQDPQGVGSAITYMRRYTALAVCGIAPVDDDGNAASHVDAKAPTQPAVPAARPQTPGSYAVKSPTAPRTTMGYTPNGKS